LGKGFVEQPVDWYPRPFWLHIYFNENEGNAHHLLTESFCYYDQPKIDLLFDQGKVFVEKAKSEGRPSFTFLFYIQLTHNDFNGAQSVDSHLASYISSLNMKSTIFMLMGDHGNRFGPVLETVVGRVESRMPYFSVLVPNSVLTKYPSVTKHLKVNEQRLTTWLDVHEMLREIPSLDLTPKEVPKKGSKPKRAYSLWREDVPEDRTCENALIPDNFCVCDHNEDLDVNNEVVKEAALNMVSFINQKLASFFTLCVPFTLNQIKSAVLVLPPKSVLKVKGFEQVLELVIEVTPSGGVFRGQVGRRASDRGVWRLRGDLTRINRYGNQSHCIKSKTLRPFCFCHHQLSNN
jgi:hypothetical protein